MNNSNITAGHRGLRVLHADDHAANRRLVQEILLAAGYQPTGCCSGAEALEQLGRHAFDVVLMDINMPGLSGIETVRRLRASRAPARNVPVIALTSELRRSLEDYRALGFNGFVSKPFVILGLLDAIEDCASAAPRPRDHVAPERWAPGPSPANHPPLAIQQRLVGRHGRLWSEAQERCSPHSAAPIKGERADWLAKG